MSTQAVVEHHLEALQAGDVEAVMSDYTDASVLIVPGRVLRGLDDIGAAMGGATETVFKPGASQFTLDAIEVDGECALITWHLESEAGSIPFGTDTFVIRDGKIAVQTGCSHRH